MKLKKLLCMVLIMAMFCSMASPLFVYATEKTQDYALLYSEDGRIIKVASKDVSKYTAVGWTTKPIEINITKNEENYKYGKGVLQVFGPENLTGSTYRKNKNIKTLYITGNVNSVCGHCFDDCVNIARVEISDTVTHIWNDAFQAGKIARVGIPKSVTYIHADAFGDWHTPKSFVIYCEKGSAAEEFAKKVKIKYVYATMIYCTDGRTMMVEDKEKSAYLESGLWNTTPLIRLYKMDGTTMVVNRNQVEANVKGGWYKNKEDVVVTMYAEDGSTQKVFKGKVAEAKKKGLYAKKSDVRIMMYALDGRTKEVYKANVEAEKKVGWYDSPIITIYAEDGRTKKIASSQKEAYLKVGWYDSPVITMYAEDGRTKKIPSSQKAAYEKVGWYDGPVMTVYNENGKSMKISSKNKEMYFKSGWYDGPVITVYSMDGRTKKISSLQKNAYLKVGWYDSPIITVYSMDGRSKKIPSSQKNAYLKVGWYDSPIIKMYAEDGRIKKIPSSQKAAYEKVGWYDGPVITVYAADGRTKKISSNDKAAYLKVGWYAAPVVVVGTMDGRRKVIKKTDLEAYKKVGWYHIPNVNLQVKESSLKMRHYESTFKIYPSNYVDVSFIQQFKYKNEGVGYAYLENNVLMVVLPKKTLKIAAKYPKLGDVIADNNGNLYVVWGKNNENEEYNTKTVFISKYTPSGSHVKTTGFVGESIMGDSGNTKVPFWAGNCSSAIGNGKLMVNYARQMYNGHQSNNVIGVNLSDMSPCKFESVWDIPYTSHSFNQRVIFSKFTKDFVYADHGDGYGRAFVITSKNREKNIFNFYLQANANYNMGIVNKTFAQMGSLLETDKGVVLVGASAKSISEKAKTEKQNLFIQIFNPDAEEINEKMFIGGVKRSGKTSFDIYDNENSPLTPVTDYGVQWITNYTDQDVVAPHAVVAGNKIVILWSNSKTYEAYYTVLAQDGKVIVPPTSLGKDVELNSYEDPIYYNGKIYWVGAYGQTVKFMSMDVPK